MIEFFGPLLTFVDENGDPQHDFLNGPALQLYIFDKTPKISTYLYALAAGAYKICMEPE
jgi:aminopeptidase N